MMRFAVSILFVLGAGALVALGLLPVWNEVQKTRVEISGLIRENDELEEIADIRGKLTAQYNAIPRSDLTRLSDLLPSSIATGQYLKDIEALSLRHGLLLQGLDFTSKSEQPQTAVRLPSPQQFIPVEMSLVVRGPYAAFRSFLGDLEKMIRITDVTSISFTAQAPSGVLGDAASAVPFEYAVRGKIYYSP